MGRRLAALVGLVFATALGAHDQELQTKLQEKDNLIRERDDKLAAIKALRPEAKELLRHEMERERPQRRCTV